MHRILVIAPHADDEVLGCGGLIARRSAEGVPVDVVALGVGWIAPPRHAPSAVTFEVRQQEMAQACRILGVAGHSVLFAGREMRLDQTPMLDLVSALDNVLAHTRYDEVYLPYAAVNHDHEITYKAALAALRVSHQPPPRLCAAYEYALIGWQPDGVPGGKLYVDIDGSPLDSKVRAAEAYKSQARPFPHPCNSRSIRTLAAMRGMEVGLAAAEMFYVLRMVEVARA